MVNRPIQFVGIMLVALVAGVFWGTWFTLTRSLETFSAAEFLAWTYPIKRSSGFYLLLASFLLMIATLLITVLVEVPIDNAIRRWTAETLPNNWEASRLTWKQFHALRTLTSVASLGALVWSVLLSSEPHTEAAPRSGSRSMSAQ